MLRGIAVHEQAKLFLDGQPVAGVLSCEGGAFTPYCATELVRIELAVVPTIEGLYLLQVQNPAGPLSNELPMCVGESKFACF